MELKTPDIAQSFFRNSILLNFLYQMGNLVSAPRSRPQIVHHGVHDTGGGSLGRLWGLVETLKDEAEANAQLARQKLERRRQRPSRREDRAHPDTVNRERVGAWMTGALGDDEFPEEPQYDHLAYQDPRSDTRGLPFRRPDRTPYHSAPERFGQADIEEGGYGYGGVPGQAYQGSPLRGGPEYRSQQHFRRGPNAPQPRRMRQGHGRRRPKGSGSESGSGQ